MDLEPRPQVVLPQLPTGHQLRAALKAAHVHAPGKGADPAAVRLAYNRLGTDGLYAVPDLWLGDAILRATGFLADSDGVAVLSPEYAQLSALPDDEACAELLSRFVTARPPLWLGAAAGEDSVAWEFVPDQEAQTLEALMPDADRREELLLVLARRVDPERDKHTGDLAEAHVVVAFREQLEGCNRHDLAERVERVSLRSDQLGYDVVAPTVDGGKRRAEVKGTLAQGPAFSITLSRNEAGRANADVSWILVPCRVGQDDSVSVIGWCTGPQLQPYMPADPPERGRWRSVEILLDQEILTPGLPPC